MVHLYMQLLIFRLIKRTRKYKATMNNEGCFRGSMSVENDLDYYEIIKEILELSSLRS